MKPYLNGVSGKNKTDITTLAGGLNMCNSKAFIEDNQMPWLMNLGIYDLPVLSIRKSRTSLAWNMSDTNLYASSKILKMFTSSKTNKLYTIEEKENIAHVYWYEIESTNNLKRTYLGQVNKAERYYVTECRDSENSYIFISTARAIYKIVEGTDGIEELQDVPSGVVAGHKNRLFVANGTSLKFSQLREYENFEITEEDVINTAGEINITNAKGNIVAMIPYDDKLIIFCDRSWHILYGDSPNSEVNQFSLVDTDDQIGCISSETVTICNRLLHWIDYNFTIYQYDGSSITKVSEPSGDDGYGGIKNLEIAQTRKKDIVMSNYDNYLHIAVTRSILEEATNDTVIVYDTNTKLWWLEDGDFSTLCKWETDNKIPYANRTDYLLGAKYNGDILILNGEDDGTDFIFNTATRECEQIPIEYTFETKTWLLGALKNTKTLTDIWLQANANADVFVCNYFSEYYPGSEDPFLKLGKLKKPNYYDMLKPNFNAHEGQERQRFIVPRMYMQKVNAFSIKVTGSGKAEFFMLEKNWRIK